MKRNYWIEHVLGKLYAVKYSDGTYTYTAYEGTENECDEFIKRKY